MAIKIQRTKKKKIRFFLLAMLVPEKGLVNRVGENNCFLNVGIQALWHLGPFRDKFLHATGMEAAGPPSSPYPASFSASPLPSASSSLSESCWRQARHVHGPSCVFCALR